MLKHLPKKVLKKLKKQCFIANNQSIVIEQRENKGHLTAQRQMISPI